MYEITDSETAYRLHTKLGPLGPCTINGNLSLTPLPGKTHVGCNTFSGKDHGVRQTHTPRGGSGTSGRSLSEPPRRSQSGDDKDPMRSPISQILRNGETD